MKELKIVDKYKPLLLLDVASTMADNNINIISINTYNIGDLSIISVFFEDEDYPKALKLAKERWNVILEPQGFIVELEDKPGELARLAKLLLDYGIEIKSSSVVNRTGKKTYIMIDTTNNDAAKRYLEKDYNIS